MAHANDRIEPTEQDFQPRQIRRCEPMHDVEILGHRERAMQNGADSSDDDELDVLG